MASDSKDSAFGILGSSKLNTADGKNPTSSATTSMSTQAGTASGQKNTEEYRQVRTSRSKRYLFGVKGSKSVLLLLRICFITQVLDLKEQY